MVSGRPLEGQVLSFRARLAVAAYVLLTWPVMTAFLFGPLALLVASSRPQGRRAWLWLAALTLWLSLWAAQPGGLLEQVVRAAAVLSTGVGVLILVLTTGSVSTRALRATFGVVLCTAALSTAVGVRWRDVELAVEQQGMAAERMAVELLSRGGASPDPATVAALQTLGEGLRPMAPFFPGAVLLLLFAGLCMAALLAPRITGRALTPLPGRFEEFRFSDHLVWLVILGLMLLLFAGTTPAAGPAASVLTFGIGLYALRGAAVLAMVLGAAPRLFIVMLLVGALFLLPFAVGGLALLGLADIWLDFRRRIAPPPSGGLDR